jgi:hypothetical protein
MTYSAGSLIVATDYNGFANNTSGGNVNYVWGTGSGDYGYGQSTTLSTVSANTVVSATNWASLNSRVTSLGSHTNTSITARTSPITGNLISILANIGTNITSCVTNRGNAVASGTTSSTWSGSSARTAATGIGNGAWSIHWTQTVTFATADSARYFWNAGGLVRIDMSKTSTGTDSDTDWNTFVGTVGTLYLSGRVASSDQTIAGTVYTGFTRVGGTGTPSTNLTTIGWYSLTSGAAATMVFVLYNSVAPYTGDSVIVYVGVNAGRTVLTIDTYWNSTARTGVGENTQISGGTDTLSPFTSFGTAPAVICRYVPPETTYLTSTWGTPTIASTVTATETAPTTTWVSPASGASIGTFTNGTTISPVTLSATTTYGTVSYSLTSGALPTGLSLSSGGVVSGTPTQNVTNQSFTVTATSSGGGTPVARSFVVTVNPGLTPGTWSQSYGPAAGEDYAVYFQTPDAAQGGVFTSIYAVYGPSDVSGVLAGYIGQNTMSFTAGNSLFGDPDPGVPKAFYISVNYS